MLPRFFVPSPARGAVPAALPDEPAQIDEVVASLVLRGAVEHELVVGLDPQRRLRVVPMSRRRELSGRAQAQLAFHEVSNPGATVIAADELYLFDLQLLELLRDAPGLNDPVYLYGVLRGPYPAALDGRAPIEGQLTVTRGDLLEGMITGIRRSFRLAHLGAGSRSVHALLPGDSLQELVNGRGVIAAFPLAPVGGATNERIAAQLLFDVLRALRADLGAQAADLPPLPVPSRAVHEAELVATGWIIEGDQARRRGRSLLSSLFGGDERIELPREGSLDELATAAQELVAKVDGLPTPSALELRQRCTGLVTPNVVRSIVSISEWPSRPLPAPPAPPAPRPEVHTPPTDWMKDFVEAHRTPANKPRLSRPARIFGDPLPEWMRDFDDPPDDE